MKNKIKELLVSIGMIWAAISFGWVVFEVIGWVFGYEFDVLSLWSLITSVICSVFLLYVHLYLKVDKFLKNRDMIDEK